MSGATQSPSRTHAPDDLDMKSDSALTTASSGTKRKRGAEPKFYAVKVGFVPGIYHSWTDCLRQVRGYKNATFKSFTSLTEAEGFMSPHASGNSATTAGTSQWYYAVLSGRVPGVYTDWPSAQKQITGWTKPKHRKFPTRAEAEAYLKAGKAEGEVATSAPAHPEPQPTASTAMAPAAKKQKKNNGVAEEIPANGTSDEPAEPGTGPLPPDAEDGFDRRLILNAKTGDVEYKTERQLNATKLQAKGVPTDGWIQIYTDGSTLGNGRTGAVAGVGVFFGPGDRRNLSEPLQGTRQTNQRAELTAIQRALDIAPLHLHARIFSDSHYSIQCVTSWFVSWRKNGWLTSGKKPVENKDLVEAIVNRIEERKRAGSKTEFTWLKGHADDPGNVAADGLAVKGARDAKAAAVA